MPFLRYSDMHGIALWTRDDVGVARAVVLHYGFERFAAVRRLTSKHLFILPSVQLTRFFHRCISKYVDAFMPPGRILANILIDDRSDLFLRSFQ